MPTKVRLAKAMVFPVVMSGRESWTIKKTELWRTDAFKLWCWRDSWESLGQQAQTSQSKGNQLWLFTESTDTEAEASILWPLDAESRLTGKDPDAVKDWGQEEKRATYDKMVGWHHQPNRHEFEQTQGDSEGQGSLACCNSTGLQSQTWLSEWTTTKENWINQQAD